MLQPETPPVCFIGDGALAMVQSELRLASSLKLGMTVIVLVDNSLNRIELKQLVKKYPSAGTRIDATDSVQLARSMDCEGYNVKTAKELEKVLAKAKPKKKPVVIGVTIDPEQYKAHF
jgi:acetolactate synthase-1/2/3 large subunit